MSIGCLCKYMSNPGDQHLKDLKKISRYIAKHSGYGLKFAPKDWQISAMSDSDWGANKTDRKSISGSVHFIGGSLVKAASHSQRLVALSTMEAELIALIEACKTVLYLRYLMADMGYAQCSATKIGVDNQSVLAVSESIMIAWKNRHIPLRYFKVRDLVMAGDIELYYVQSDDNTADCLTKALGQPLFQKHRASLISKLPPMDHTAAVPIFT